jgi:hypothetical protein
MRAVVREDFARPVIADQDPDALEDLKGGLVHPFDLFLGEQVRVAWDHG